MKLQNLRVACYLYNQFSNYDQKYLDLSNKYLNLDLNVNDHITDLIKWLRSWGCRQFKKDCENISIFSIKDWYETNSLKIPDNNNFLIDYDLDNNKEKIIQIFDDLSNRLASNKKNKNKIVKVRIGPVGTAKILFALRPNFFSPWDTPIYNQLKLQGNGSGYIMYLRKIRHNLKYIKIELERKNINWANIFTYLNKEHKSYTKLIDEYFWITITKGFDISVIEEIFKGKTA